MVFIHAKIILEKLIRHELAAGRDYNENHICIGFGKASDVWLK